MTQEQLFGLLRHILTIVGTFLVINGQAVDAASWQMVTGSVIALASVVWSIFAKKTTIV